MRPCATLLSEIKQTAYQLDYLGKTPEQTAELPLREIYTPLFLNTYSDCDFRCVQMPNLQFGTFLIFGG